MMGRGEGRRLSIVVFHAEEALKEVSLKLVEFSDQKFYMQFGMSHDTCTHVT